MERRKKQIAYIRTVKYVFSNARDNKRALRKSLYAIFLYPSNPRLRKLNIWAKTGAAGLEKFLVKTMVLKSRLKTTR